MDNENAAWVDRPATRRLIRRVLYAACALLAVADFVVSRHIYTAIERVPAFYALYGFVALVGVVLAAKALRLIVRRDEEYYDR
jgi:hypothetical protein